MKLSIFPLGTVIALVAAPVQAAGPLDAAAPYLYERCLESFSQSDGLEAELAGTRFTRVSYAPAESFGARHAYAHPDLGATRIWETREESSAHVQLGCTMLIDGGATLIIGGDPNAQFDGIAAELSDELGDRIAKQLREQMGDYAALTAEGMRNSLDLGGATLSHVLTRGIPGNPDKGYILSVFLSKPK